ncbi:TPA: glycerol dehydrogenase [Klebsiella pneumoniae]|jgi:glycerol dehydrogenase|uniref:Glycerol dehydrogenase n=1 Tax=Klebsiella oxytoca TaxID=571 RepID=A0A318FP71_KLEOX|nr:MULTISPECIES: glycerol dehydrogenase [Klebsiella]MCS5939767.1 glycerol dehydrogenase [Klebsiella variicola subsp. variicola]HBR6268375.1 glycerol dehydrogenase [Klebsiella pneumoniae]MBK0162420.1 glycerol dehydrogenase [Klebsiella sp. S69]PXW39566.1 glycerol 2-dehydrogenase (NAD+) [Klebsiella oxytoca]HDK6616061.1 glycerol dehydrogenase [Klebsiella variicola]
MVTTAIFPGRYVQGANAIDECLADELLRLGQRAFIVQDPTVNKLIGPRIDALLANKIATKSEVFCSECCDEEIERISALTKAFEADVIVGIGGGKTLDTAKATGAALGLPIVIVPTLASTDAPCSSLVVIYTREGKFKRYLMIPQNPTLVLVDTQIIANAPARFLVSGMGDALATWFEAEDCRIKGAGNMTTRPGPMTAFGLARMCFDVLLKYGVLAKAACEQKMVTPALEHIVEANTLLSGLGFESGGLAAAHAIHNGLTVLPETHSYWHGEKVAFGTLAMLMLTDREPELIDTVYTFCESVGLPTTLAQIGLNNVTDEQLLAVATASCQEGETMHNEPYAVTPERILAALRAADAYGVRRQ